MSTLWQRVPVLLAVFFAVFHFHCAYIAPPPGGPADSTSPGITAVFPAPGAVLQSRSLDAVFEFSEWINAAFPANSIYISPSIPEKLAVKSGGKRITVTSPSQLDSNTTYIITLLGQLKDLSGNSLSGNYNLIFSTGPKIDSGRFGARISGLADNSKPAVAGLYPAGPERFRMKYLTEPGARVPDSLANPGRERPMYLMAADSSGEINFSGIRRGEYGLLAFIDGNSNLRPDIGTEPIGIGAPELRIPQVAPIRLRLSKYDTVRPRLVSAEWFGERIDSSVSARTSEGTILLKFSGAMDPLGLDDKANFVLMKSDSIDTIPITGVDYLESPGALSIQTHPLMIDTAYAVFCLSGNDIYGNPLSTERNFLKLTPDGKTDTVLRITSETIVNGDSLVFITGPVKFGTSLILTPLRLDQLKKSIFCLADGDTLAVSLESAGHRFFKLKLPRLEYKGQAISVLRKFLFKDSIPLFPIRPPDSAADSTLAGSRPRDTGDSAKFKDTVRVSYEPLVKFRLANQRNWGKCRIVQEAPYLPLTLVFQRIDSKREVHRISKQGKYSMIDSLPSGKYRLEYYHDSNENGRWDPGQIRKWTSQEYYGTHSDTLDIKAGETLDARLSGS